jgi:hypothetical protein
MSHAIYHLQKAVSKVPVFEAKVSPIPHSDSWFVPASIIGVVGESPSETKGLSLTHIHPLSTQGCSGKICAGNTRRLGLARAT